MVDSILSNTSLNNIVSSSGYDFNMEGEEDVSMESDFNEQCLDMWIVNKKIRQAVLKSAGMIYVHKYKIIVVLTERFTIDDEGDNMRTGVPEETEVNKDTTFMINAILCDQFVDDFTAVYYLLQHALDAQFQT